jgi:hypothetical protein
MCSIKCLRFMHVLIRIYVSLIGNIFPRGCPWKKIWPHILNFLSGTPLSFLARTNAKEDVIKFVFPPSVLHNPLNCLNRGIVAPTNKQVNEYNSVILDRIKKIFCRSFSQRGFRHWHRHWTLHSWLRRQTNAARSTSTLLGNQNKCCLPTTAKFFNWLTTREKRPGRCHRTGQSNY